MTWELVGRGLVSSLKIEVGKDANEQGLGVKPQSSCAWNNG